MALSSIGLPRLAYTPANSSNMIDIAGEEQQFAVSPAPVLTAALPLASVAGFGSYSFVSDATTNTFGSTLVGGGTNNVSVFVGGTTTPTWLIG